MEHTGIKPKVIQEIRTFARKYNIDKVIYWYVGKRIIL